MSQSDVAVVREIYDAFNRGDIERVTELLHPDIEWVEPEGYPVPEGRGTVIGRDAVLRVFERYPEHWESFGPTPEELYDAGDGVVFVVGRQEGRGLRTGREVSSSFVNLWRVRDGQAVLHRSWSDTKLLGQAVGAEDGDG